MEREFSGLIFRLNPEVQVGPAGWRRVFPVKLEDFWFEPVLRDVLPPGQASITCYSAVLRAKSNGVRSGLSYADAMLRENQKFPLSWREHEFLIFPEVWDRPNLNPVVPVIRWERSFWRLQYVHLGHTFHHGCIVEAFIKTYSHQPVTKPQTYVDCDWTPCAH